MASTGQNISHRIEDIRGTPLIRQICGSNYMVAKTQKAVLPTGVKE